MHKVIYTKKATEDLDTLELDTAKRIALKIYNYSLTTTPLHFAKKLRNHDVGEYRFRIGNYRAIFETDKEGNIFILTILRIKHRKEVYKD